MTMNKQSRPRLNGKKKGKNVSAPKVRSVAAPVIRSRGDLKVMQITPESSIAAVEYRKVSTTLFSILLNDVPMRSSQSKASYDVAWKVPGYNSLAGKSSLRDGVAAHLSHTDYNLRNDCDYELGVRFQRPLGFRSDPGGIAMWEPVAKSHDLVIMISPRQSVKLSVSHGATSMMCPRHLTYGGQDFIHLSSLCVFRESVNVHGNDPIVPDKTPVQRAGIALEIEAQTHYRVNDGQVGQVKDDYLVIQFDTSTHMDFISPGPIQPVRLMDVCEDLEVQHFAVVPSGRSMNSTKQLSLVAVFKNSDSNTASFVRREFDTLDIDTKYRLPVGVPVGSIDIREPVTAKRRRGSSSSSSSFDMELDDVESGSVEAIADVIYFDKEAKEWKLCVEMVKKEEVLKDLRVRELTQFSFITSHFPAFSLLEYLHPVRFNMVKSRVGFKNKPIRGAPFPVGKRHDLSNYHDNWAVKTVNAIVTIVEVLNVVSQFAAAFALLKMEDRSITVSATGRDTNSGS